MEKAPVHAFGLHKAHGARVAVRQNGLRVARGNRVQSGRNIRKRLVPTHWLEPAAPLGPHALERLEHTALVVGALGVLAHLGAQHAVGLRV
ncbi:hypothetical protein D3C71_1942990 [compost metagenome]